MSAIIETKLHGSGKVSVSGKRYRKSAARTFVCEGRHVSAMGREIVVSDQQRYGAADGFTGHDSRKNLNTVVFDRLSLASSVAGPTFFRQNFEVFGLNFNAGRHSVKNAAKRWPM
jgi:hypothetical protein